MKSLIVFVIQPQIMNDMIRIDTDVKSSVKALKNATTYGLVPYQCSCKLRSWYYIVAPPYCACYVCSLQGLGVHFALATYFTNHTILIFSMSQSQSVDPLRRELDQFQLHKLFLPPRKKSPSAFAAFSSPSSTVSLRLPSLATVLRAHPNLKYVVLK